MSHYDGFAREYDEAVARHSPVIECAYEYILDQLKEVSGHQVCDVGCGQGELARRLARAGARVTGVDLSGELLNLARTRSSTQTIEWVHDDAQSLRALPDNRFDIAVANLMLMDTPEFQKVFEAVHRILVPGGQFIWTVTHPCFQSPHSATAADHSGAMRQRIITAYDEQWWKSDGHGTIRGTLGAYHRPIAVYLNAFIASGFRLSHLAEPTAGADAPDTPDRDQTIHSILPPVLGVVGVKACLTPN